MKTAAPPSQNPPPLVRREFLSLFPALLGPSLLQQRKQKNGTRQHLSAVQKKTVSDSSMARQLENYFGKGFSCAESGLMVGLNYLKKPPELVAVAGGFGGGILHRDLCGFLTAGVMVLGLAAQELCTERATARKWCRTKVRDFWSWWQEQAPLHCADIRPPGSASTICRNLGRLSAARIQSLITL